MGLMIIQRRPQRVLSQEDTARSIIYQPEAHPPQTTSASTQSWASQTPELEKRTPEPKKKLCCVPTAPFMTF